MPNSLKIKNYKLAKKAIVKLLNKGALTEAKEKLDELNIHSEDYYSLYSNYYYLTEEYEKGISLLDSAVKKIPHSFEITYNLASLIVANGEYVESLLLFAKSARIASSEKDKKEAIDQIKQISELLKNTSISKEDLDKYLKKANDIIHERDERTYPINRFNTSLVKRTVQDNEGNLYFTEMYKSMHIQNVDNNSRYFFKNEMLPGEASQSYTFNVENEVTVPIGLFMDYADIVIEGPSNYLFPKNTLTPNQFNYYTFCEKGEYKISSKKIFFVGKPIDLKPEKKSAQVILSLFIDGLANTAIENNLEELMPNTYKFFSKGYVNNNCFTTGDWTLPSVSSIYTGKSTLNHGLYHPTNHYELNGNNKLFPEYFREQGYFTAQINNDWRITPTYGYFQGMDRILYQMYSGGFTAGEVIAETVEHLETFKDNNHYLWVSLMDLHDIADEINNDLMSQVKIDPKYRQSKNLGVTSVLSEYDENKIAKYDVELKRIDLHLASLYNYLESTFGLENVIVSLVSDHGQTYLKHDEFLLHEPKRKVPFMLVGGDIQPKVSNEICAITDIFPTIANLTGVKVDNQEGVVLKDFGGNGREYAMTETLHPNQPYLVAITDNEFIFRFKTKANVTENTLVDLENYEAWLIDKESETDVSYVYKDKLNYYSEMVLQRASRLQI